MKRYNKVHKINKYHDKSDPTYIFTKKQNYSKSCKYKYGVIIKKNVNRGKKDYIVLCNNRTFYCQVELLRRALSDDRMKE